MHATISFPCKQFWLPNHSVKTAKLNKVVGQLNFSFLFFPSALLHYPPSRLLLSCSNPFILFLQGHPTQSTLSCLNKPIKGLDLVHALLSPPPLSFPALGPFSAQLHKFNMVAPTLTFLISSSLPTVILLSANSHVIVGINLIQLHCQLKLR